MSEDTTPEQPVQPAADDQQAESELTKRDREEREARMKERGNRNVPDRDDPTTADAGTEAPS